MGVEARYAKLVGGIVDDGRVGVHGRFGRKFYRARRGLGKGVVAFSDGRRSECGADDVCGGWEAIRGNCGWVVAVCVCIAIVPGEMANFAEAQGMLEVGLKAQVLDASATQAGKTYADSQYESPFRRVNIRS